MDLRGSGYGAEGSACRLRAVREVRGGQAAADLLVNGRGLFGLIAMERLEIGVVTECVLTIVVVTSSIVTDEESESFREQEAAYL